MNDTANPPQTISLIRAGDIWGAFVYCSMFGSRAAGDYESAREAQRVYNFKHNGTGGAKIKEVFERLAARLGCVAIVACPGHGVKETRLQELFGVTIRRRAEVASRKYAHKTDIDFDAESATLELSYETAQRLKGRRVLVLDDVATTGKTLRFYKRYFEERGIFAELAAIGINKKLNPEKVEEITLVQPVPQSTDLLTKADLAAAWNIAPSSVHDIFSTPGAPIFVDGKISRAEADAWYAQRTRRFVKPNEEAGLAITEARRKQEEFKARLLELDYKTKTGELIPRAEVEANCREDGARIRAALMAMPARIAPTLADAVASGGIPAVAAALEADVRRTLEALASLKSLDMEGGENGTQATQ